LSRRAKIVNHERRVGKNRAVHAFGLRPEADTTLTCHIQQDAVAMLPNLLAGPLMTLLKIFGLHGNAQPAMTPEQMGIIGLVLAGAGLAGVLVYRWLAPTPGAAALGVVASTAVIAVLSYCGVVAASVVLWGGIAIVAIAVVAMFVSTLG
jgi:hypothetical protein